MTTNVKVINFGPREVTLYRVESDGKEYPQETLPVGDVSKDIYLHAGATLSVKEERSEEER